MPFPSPYAAQRGSMKILVAEDNEASRALLRMILTSEGYEVCEAVDGPETLEVFAREEPDMVVLDVTMPRMDGYEVARQITRKLAKNFVPVIFLTALSDEASMLKCYESGGDEVLFKPINRVVLLARIRAMQRILSLYVSLEDYRARTEEELFLARHIFATITQPMKEFIPGLGHWTQSAGHLPGDLILYDTAPSGKIYAMMADFTGHGLSAAVGAIPVADIFFSLTRKDLPLADIIVEINRKLRQVFPVGHFCAATFVSSDPVANEVKVWNAGLPEAYLVSQERKILQCFPSKNLALAIVDIDVSDIEMATVTNVRGSKLVIYTDGLTEAENNAGVPLGRERFVEAIECSVGQPLFEGLKAYILDYCGKQKPHDDLSLLVLPVNYSQELEIWADRSALPVA